MNEDNHGNGRKNWISILSKSLVCGALVVSLIYGGHSYGSIKLYQKQMKNLSDAIKIVELQIQYH